MGIELAEVVIHDLVLGLLMVVVVLLQHDQLKDLVEIEPKRRRLLLAIRLQCIL